MQKLKSCKLRTPAHKFEAAFILMAVLALQVFPAAQAKVPLAQIGKNIVKLEVALTDEQIQRGLMFRSSLPEDQGMIFLFRPPRKVRFWMYNCLISLDMLFIKDGKIVKISHDVAPCKSHKREDCPLYPDDGEIFATEVLELNAGYCARHGIKEGDLIEFSLPGVKGAKKASGEAKSETPLSESEAGKPED